jgi:hypothetical protein
MYFQLSENWNEYITSKNICYQSYKDIPSGPNCKYLYEIERTSGGSTDKISSDIILNNCAFYYLSYDTKNMSISYSSHSPSSEFQKGKE